MAVGLAPIGNDAPFFLSTGVAASGAKLFIYAAGSTTKSTSYSDSGGTTPNANPVVLNSSGYPASAGNRVAIWLTTGSSYKFVLAPSTDTDPPASAYWTLDNIPVINDVSSSQNEWVPGPTPTYVSATQFTLVGDQTTNFTVGRRIKVTETAGTAYGRITVSAFTTLTTVTVVMDASSTLDSGLSAVSYGILQASNPSAPFIGGTSTLPFNNQTGTTYTVAASDNGKIVTFTNAGAITVTLPAPGTVKSGFWCFLKNIGTTVVTVNRSGAENIFGPGLANGGATGFTLPYSGSVVGMYNISGVGIATNGTDWHIFDTLETHGEQTYTAAGSFVVPAGVTGVWVDGAAGGASGGGAANAANTAGGGGSAGQATLAQFFSVTPGATATITIGQAGAAPSAGNNNGNNGTNTTVTGAFALTLTAGNAGSGAAAGTSGAGGTSPGTGAGSGSIGGGTSNTGGPGGGNIWAPPSFPTSGGSQNGVAGNLYGGGGSGSSSNGGGASAGGAGANGFLRIRW